MPSMIEAYQLSGAAKNISEHINGTNSASPASTFKHKFDDLENPTYPTRSLNFLKDSKTAQTCTSLPEVAQSTVQLKVLIIGAGLGGLATAVALARRGHTVEILEQAHALGEVGAGIQIPSNSSRILLEWGLEPFLAGKVVEPDGISFRRWQDGEAIGFTKLVPEFRDTYKAPYYVVHRAHFHEALLQLAQKLGVTIRLGARVTEYNERDPSVTLSDGDVVTAKLVVAVDGIKSLARRCIPGQESVEPVHNGFAAYRATVDVEKMKADPETAWLLKKPALNIWIGADCHVMTYTISSGKSFNMVLSHVDKTNPATWHSADLLGDMRRCFQHWDPKLLKIINMIEKTMKWPLMTVPTMDRWISDSGKLLVLGDAAHAMVPYMSQGKLPKHVLAHFLTNTSSSGAAMAVEDGAALAEALSHARSVEDLPHLLSVFEEVRATRCGQMQQASLINGKIWHFADGPKQEARDLAMRPEVLGLSFEESPNQWSDPETQKWAYGYDAVEAIASALEAQNGVDTAPSRLSI